MFFLLCCVKENVFCRPRWIRFFFVFILDRIELMSTPFIRLLLEQVK